MTDPSPLAGGASSCLVVRHAHAITRGDWQRPDAERPLSPRGGRQAERFATAFAGLPINKVLSSPARRCVATVAPLAESVGVPVEEVDYLAEGADGNKALAVLLEQTSTLGGQSALVACSHGDVLNEVVAMLVARGALERELAVPKGGTILLSVVDGDVRRAELLPPPS